MPQVILNYTNTKIQDNYVRSDAPTSTYNLAVLSAGKGSSATFNALLQFELNAIPNNAVINSATLRLVTTTTIPSVTLNIYQILTAWTETTTTWNTRPSYDTELEATFSTVASTGAEHIIDIKNLVQKWVNGEANNGLLIGNDTATTTNVPEFYSLTGTSAASRPTLTIDYTIPTEDKKQVEYVDSSLYNSSSGLVTHSITLPTVKTINDLLVLYITGTQGASGAFTPPSGWTLLSNQEYYTGRPQIILYKRYSGVEATVDLTFATNAAISVYAVTYRNVKSISANTINRMSSNSIYPSQVTNLPNNSLLTIFISKASITTNTPPLNFIERYDTSISGTHASTLLDTYIYSKNTYTSEEMTSTTSSTSGAGLTIITLEPIQNEVPTIDGQDEYLGAFDTPLTKQYTVTDTEGDNVTIVEKLEGVTINTRSSAGTYTLDLSAQWDDIWVGNHTVTVEVYDDYDSSRIYTRTWTFTKLLSVDASQEDVDSNAPIVINKLKDLKQMLVDKVGGDVTDSFESIIEGVELGKKWAKGTITSDGSNKVIITGLNFTPRLAIALRKNFTGVDFGIAQNLDANGTLGIRRSGTTTSVGTVSFSTDGASVHVYSIADYDWYAYE